MAGVSVSVKVPTTVGFQSLRNFHFNLCFESVSHNWGPTQAFFVHLPSNWNWQFIHHIILNLISLSVNVDGADFFPNIKLKTLYLILLGGILINCVTHCKVAQLLSNRPPVSAGRLSDRSGRDATLYFHYKPCVFVF